MTSKGTPKNCVFVGGIRQQFQQNSIRLNKFLPIFTHWANNTKKDEKLTKWNATSLHNVFNTCFSTCFWNSWFPFITKIFISHWCCQITTKTIDSNKISGALCAIYFYSTCSHNHFATHFITCIWNSWFPFITKIIISHWCCKITTKAINGDKISGALITICLKKYTEKNLISTKKLGKSFQNLCSSWIKKFWNEWRKNTIRKPFYICGTKKSFTDKYWWIQKRVLWKEGVKMNKKFYFLNKKIPLVGNVIMVPRSVPKIWSLELGAWSLELEAWSLELTGRSWSFDMFFENFFNFSSKKNALFLCKKKVLWVAFGACESVFKTDT